MKRSKVKSGDKHIHVRLTFVVYVVAVDTHVLGLMEPRRVSVVFVFQSSTLATFTCLWDAVMRHWSSGRCLLCVARPCTASYCMSTIHVTQQCNASKPFTT